jgi:hypothetical protein
MEVATKVFTPEFKSRLFSKIENNDDAVSVSNIQILLNTIDNVSTVYSVDINQIKSKNNFFNTNAYKQKKQNCSHFGLHAVQEKS